MDGLLDFLLVALLGTLVVVLSVAFVVMYCRWNTRLHVLESEQRSAALTTAALVTPFGATFDVLSEGGTSFASRRADLGQCVLVEDDIATPRPSSPPPTGDHPPTFVSEPTSFTLGTVDGELSYAHPVAVYDARPVSRGLTPPLPSSRSSLELNSGMSPQVQSAEPWSVSQHPSPHDPASDPHAAHPPPLEASAAGGLVDRAEMAAVANVPLEEAYGITTEPPPPHDDAEAAYLRETAAAWAAAAARGGPMPELSEVKSQQTAPTNLLPPPRNPDLPYMSIDNPVIRNLTASGALARGGALEAAQSALSSTLSATKASNSAYHASLAALLGPAVPESTISADRDELGAARVSLRQGMLVGGAIGEDGGLGVGPGSRGGVSGDGGSREGEALMGDLRLEGSDALDGVHPTVAEDAEGGVDSSSEEVREESGEASVEEAESPDPPEAVVRDRQPSCDAHVSSISSDSPPSPAGVGAAENSITTSNIAVVRPRRASRPFNSRVRMSCDPRASMTSPVRTLRSRSTDISARRPTDGAVVDRVRFQRHARRPRTRSFDADVMRRFLFRKQSYGGHSPSTTSTGGTLPSSGTAGSSSTPCEGARGRTQRAASMGHSVAPHTPTPPTSRGKGSSTTKDTSGSGTTSSVRENENFMLHALHKYSLSTTRTRTPMSRSQSHLKGEARHVVSKRLLGRGSFGSVFAGTDLVTGKAVAVKRSHWPVVGAEREDWRREIRLLRMFSHPNIVQFLDTWMTDDGHVVLVTEKLEQSVAELQRAQRCLPVALTAKILADAVTGLAVLHAAGVLHLDIKPENILLDINGTARIGDFGLSAFISLREEGEIAAIPQDDGSATAVRQRVRGTLVYLSPELMDANILTEAADVWAIGATAVVMMCGFNLYRLCGSSDPIQFMYRTVVRREDVPLPPQLPPAAFDFCRQCLALDFAQRPSAFSLLNHPFLQPFVRRDAFTDSSDQRDALERTYGPVTALVASQPPEPYPTTVHEESSVTQGGSDDIMPRPAAQFGRALRTTGAGHTYFGVGGSATGDLDEPETVVATATL